jgi:hypothetical protein
MGWRRQWRAHLDGEPPTHLPRWLLIRVLAYRLQADTFGGPDKSIQRRRARVDLTRLPNRRRMATFLHEADG